MARKIHMKVLRNPGDVLSSELQKTATLAEDKVYLHVTNRLDKLESDLLDPAKRPAALNEIREIAAKLQTENPGLYSGLETRILQLLEPDNTVIG